MDDSVIAALVSASGSVVSALIAGAFGHKGIRKLRCRWIVILVILVTVAAVGSGLIAYRLYDGTLRRIKRDLPPREGFKTAIYRRVGLGLRVPRDWDIYDAAFRFGGGELRLVRRRTKDGPSQAITFQFMNVVGKREAETSRFLDSCHTIDRRATVAEDATFPRYPGTRFSFKGRTGRRATSLETIWTWLTPYVKLEIRAFTLLDMDMDEIRAFESERDDILQNAVLDEATISRLREEVARHIETPPLVACPGPEEQHLWGIPATLIASLKESLAAEREEHAEAKRTLQQVASRAESVERDRDRIKGDLGKTTAKLAQRETQLAELRELEAKEKALAAAAERERDAVWREAAMLKEQVARLNREKAAREVYEEVTKKVAASPKAHEENLQALEKAVEDTKGTQYTTILQREVDRRQKTLKDDIARTAYEEVMTACRQLPMDFDAQIAALEDALQTMAGTRYEGFKKQLESLKTKALEAKGHKAYGDALTQLKKSPKNYEANVAALEQFKAQAAGSSWEAKIEKLLTKQKRLLERSKK